MRPLRLFLDGFGCYRRPADIDLSDVDFFALVGPTGAGKSTVVDGLCFALYGTVPRWGKENVIADALAPSANSCRVCLVFETAGARYAAVRALVRNRRGQVHTKEARLDRLDASVPASAHMEKLLAASAEQVAEGPDAVASRVRELLGLTYEHFTQSVLLPQGRFAEFLQAKPRERQDLLVGLLALGVYEQVGQRARERAQRAAERVRVASHARDELAGATEQAEAAAADRVAALADLAAVVDGRLAEFTKLRDAAAAAAQRAESVRAELAQLAEARMPAGVRGLAERIAAADVAVAEAVKRRDEADSIEAEASRSRDSLPDKAKLERFQHSYAERRNRSVLLAQRREELARHEASEARLARELAAAEAELDDAANAQAAARNAHAAAALAQTLRAGDDCPVCLRPVTALPRHAVPALSAAQARAEAASRSHRRAQAAHRDAAKAVAGARGTVEATQRLLAEIGGQLAEAPGEAEVQRFLTAVAAADRTLEEARRRAHTARAAVTAAERGREAIADAERKAWAGLRQARDTIVSLGAPAVADTDLATAWQSLLEWAASQHARRMAELPALQATAEAAARDAGEKLAGVRAALAGHGVGTAADPAQFPVLVAGMAAEAKGALDDIRRDRRRAAKLDKQIAAGREEEHVATMLGNLLRANSFERWLCTEALDSLVTEASATLMELSGGQYQLSRDDRNNLFVIDHNDAAAQRPVHTLSGGETFQASLALALALSHQVTALSGGMRDLNAMFLDEGFGTLDPDTLDTVASTLERLAGGSERMVGIVTHVAALAERVPVRFVVSREGATSVLHRERA